MKNAVLLLLVVFNFSLHAVEGATISKAEADSPSAWRPWLTEFRAGLVTTNPDHAVTSSKWEHQAFKSYQYSVGVMRMFPQAWKQLRFFMGSEFLYLTAKEEMSGAYTATIDVTIVELIALGGVVWKPHWLGGSAGVRAATKYAVWGEKTSKLDAEGFSQDLGKDNTRVNKGTFNIPFFLAVTGFYDIGSLQLSATLEARSKGTVFTGGIGYAF